MANKFRAKCRHSSCNSHNGSCTTYKRYYSTKVNYSCQGKGLKSEYLPWIIKRFSCSNLNPWSTNVTSWLHAFEANFTTNLFKTLPFPFMKNFVQSKNTINFHLNCELCKAWCALAVIQSPAQSFMLVFHSLNSPDIRGISLWVLPKSYWTTTSLPYGSSWSPHRSQSTQLLTCLLRLRSIRNMIVII